MSAETANQRDHIEGNESASSILKMSTSGGDECLDEDRVPDHEVEQSSLAT